MIDEQEILNASILIVDDQKLYIRLLEQILETAGYLNITSTANAREAVSICEDLQPDGILLDLKMPHIDGFQIMNEIKRIKSEYNLPILALSEEIDQEIRLKALEAGATDFLSKPFESTEVLMRIHNMIETSLLHKKINESNKILEAKVEERTKELSSTRLDIIRRLARAAEFRDNDTGIHIIRMSHYCAKLGEAIGMNKEECDLLLHASPLHDVGKIAIPDTILLKPGKLTPEEWDAMKKHTKIAAELLSGSNSDIMKMAQEIALTHHEKWDGTGYPRGLKGEEIPLTGRLCSLCDVFDALTATRPYKEAWPVEKAVEEIKKGSGTQFDPNLVDCFINILPEIIKIKENYPG